MERPHGQLCSRLTDRLCRNDTNRLALFDQSPAGQVAPITGAAHTASRLTGQHRTNLHAVDRSFHDRLGAVFINLFVERDDDLTRDRVTDIFRRQTTQYALFDRLDNFATFDQRAHNDAIGGAAIDFVDDHILRNVDQTTREITGVGSLQGRVGQSLTGTVR